MVSSKDFIFIGGGKISENKTDDSVIKINLEPHTQENITPMNSGKSYFTLLELPWYNPNE